MKGSFKVAFPGLGMFTVSFSFDSGSSICFDVTPTSVGMVHQTNEYYIDGSTVTGHVKFYDPKAKK